MESITTIDVRFREVDSAQVAHHSHFFDWFEVGRFDLIRTCLGLSPLDLKAHGIMAPVVEAHCRYLSPGLLGDRIVIHTRWVPTESAKAIFRYKLQRNTIDGELIAVGRTTHVFLNREGRLCLEVPTNLRERMAEYESARAGKLVAAEK